MKKTTVLAAFAAVYLCSCTGSSKGNATEEDSLQIEEVATLDEAVDLAVENVVADLSKTLESGDTETLKTEVEKVSEKIMELVKSGDSDKAIEYADQVKKFALDNVEKLKQLQKEGNATAKGLMEIVEALPSMAEEAAQETEEAVKAQANATEEAAKQKANEKLNDAAQKANEKVEEAKQKAADALNKAVEKLKNQ